MAVTATAPRLGFAEGLRAVPAAIGILSRCPTILLWLVPPLLITLLLDVVAFYFAFGWMRAGIRHFVSGQGYSAWLASLLDVFGGIAVVLLLGWTFAWLFLTLASPFQDFISAAVEREKNGGTAQEPVGVKGFVTGMVRGGVQAIVLLMLTVPVLILGFFPVVGPVVVFLWSSFVMGFSFVTIPLRRLRERIALASRHRGAVLGLGSVIAVAAIVPLVNVLCMPVFVVAGTLIYLKAGERSVPPTRAG
jgi:CysZ protein